MTLSPIDPTNPPQVDENGVLIDPSTYNQPMIDAPDSSRSDVEDDDSEPVDESPDVD